MRRVRVALAVGLAAVLAAAMIGWAVLEARAHRHESLRALEREAGLLAGSLGPALAAATAAADELDEQMAGRLVDGARLLGRVEREARLTPFDLEHERLESGFDSVVLLARDGTVRARVGPPVPPDSVAQARDVAAGVADLALLEWGGDTGEGHRAAVVAAGSRGAVLVSVDLGEAFSFARSIGVQNLLQRLVDSGSVLYLVYRERGVDSEASWDGAAAPPPADPGDPRRTVRGRDSYEIAVPIAGPPGRTGTLRVGLDAAPLLSSAALARRRTLVVVLVLALVGVSGLALTMISGLRAAERQESTRRLALEVEARRRSERLAAAGTLAAGLAHEVRGPLNAIALAAQRIARRHGADDDCGAFAATIRDEVQRMDGVLRNFLDLARPGSGETTDADLAALAHDVAALLALEAREKNVALAVKAAPLTARVDREAVRRALVNLVRNAIEATPAGSTVEIRVSDVAGAARVIVRDEGPGVPESIRGRLFEPFVTGRADGTGLGLALVRRVAEDHGGSVDLIQRTGSGVDAVLEIPRSQEVT